VLATVDFDLMFTYVCAGWEGSTHDSTVLRHSLEHPNDLRVPEGKYYLADAGYAARRGFLPPFRQTRYIYVNGEATNPRHQMNYSI
jgi:hypothetical protein